MARLPPVSALGGPPGESEPSRKHLGEGGPELLQGRSKEVMSAAPCRSGSETGRALRGSFLGVLPLEEVVPTELPRSLRVLAAEVFPGDLQALFLRPDPAHLSLSGLRR